MFDVRVVGNQHRISFQRLADADKSADSLVFQQFGNLPVQFRFVLFALQNVRQNHCFFRVQAQSVEKIQCNCQRIDVRIIRVIDYGTVVYARLHLKPHCNGRNICQTLTQQIRIDALNQRKSNAMHDIFHRSRIGKRNFKPLFSVDFPAQIRIIYKYFQNCSLVGLNFFNKLQIAVFLLSPSKKSVSLSRLGDNFVQHNLIGTVNQQSRADKQLQFLSDFVFDILKIFLMCVANICKYANIRMNDFFQTIHFVGHRNSRLKNSEFRFGVSHQNRQWHACLRIVTLWTSADFLNILKYPANPFLDAGFAVAAGNSEYRKRK